MNRRPICYVAHPVSGDVQGNVARALRWLKHLRETDHDRTYIAPWIEAILSGADDADEAQRARGLIDCVTVVGRCDEIVLVGGRVSSGMRCEVNAAEAIGIAVRDLTSLGDEPPAVGSRR